METKDYKALLSEYRYIMEKYTEGAGFMDWRSDVYVSGIRKCLEIVEEWLPKSSSVIDYGCGMGLFSVFLKISGYETTGMDINIGGIEEETGKELYGGAWGSTEDEIEKPELLKEVWNRLHDEFGTVFYSFAGEKIPEENGSFDALVAHAVFEHIHPSLLDNSIREIHRVLKPGGFFFIFRTPRKTAYLEKLAHALNIPAHELIYSETEVIDIVEAAGFLEVGDSVTDMVPSFPPFSLDLYNKFTPCLTVIDELLLKTPLRKYAHHMALVFKK
ncbi:MAG: methyltransferase domain-containing protein [Dehalococcoidales bacterium]|nr:methyltransferase domain-containing protein [Dehalococcoidales bacterium]